MTETEIAALTVEDLVRLLGPAAGMAVVQAGEISVLKESLAGLEALFEQSDEHITEACGRIEIALKSIDAQVKATNGRVTALEQAKAIAEGVRLARAADLEERRKAAAESIARHGWVRPMVGGGVMTFIIGGLSKAFGLV